MPVALLVAPLVPFPDAACTSRSAALEPDPPDAEAAAALAEPLDPSPPAASNPPANPPPSPSAMIPTALAATNRRDVGWRVPAAPCAAGRASTGGSATMSSSVAAAAAAAGPSGPSGPSAGGSYHDHVAGSTGVVAGGSVGGSLGKGVASMTRQSPPCLAPGCAPPPSSRGTRRRRPLEHPDGERERARCRGRPIGSDHVVTAPDGGARPREGT